MNKKKKTILYLLVIIIISIFMSIITIELVKDPQIYIDTINKKHLSIILSYVLLSIVQTIVPIVPGEPVELLGGYLFGAINGSLICLACESVASVFIILISRKYGKKIINYLFEDKKIATIEKLKTKKAFSIFSLLFILPGTPKDLLCYFSGIADYDLIPLLIITTIGRIPSIVTSTISANYLQNEKYLVSILIYAITVIICFIDILIYRIMVKKKSKN